MACQVVKVRADFDKGVPTPLLFKFITAEEEQITVIIQRIIKKDINKMAGNIMWVFSCECVTADNLLKTFELRYELASCKWYLIT